MPDGFIIQHPLKIIVETKMHEGFSESQLRRHLDTNSNQKLSDLVLMLLSPQGEPDEKMVSSLRDKATIVITSFREIISAARESLSKHDEDMNALVDDYEAFCSESGLLPRDDYTLFVASCGYTIEMNARLKLYYCSSSWNRRKSKYLGIYGNKVVQHIGRINNVVSCDLNQDGTLNIIEGEPNSDEQERIKTAIQEQGLFAGFKFFLCSEMEKESQTAMSKSASRRLFKNKGLLQGLNSFYALKWRIHLSRSRRPVQTGDIATLTWVKRLVGTRMYRIVLRNSRRNSGTFLGHPDTPKYDKRKNLDYSGHIGYYLNSPL